LHDVTREQWDEMKDRGEHRHYTVEDDSDDHFNSVEIKVEPIELIPEVEGTNDGVNEGVNDDLVEKMQEAFDEEGEKEFYRSFLDGKGIEYDKRIGLKKLKALYEENL